MLVAVAGTLLVTGLLCVWVSLDHLSQVEREDAEAQTPEEPESEEEEPRLTRLGRPIVEVRVRA
jgi:hypothetical protein